MILLMPSLALAQSGKLNEEVSLNLRGVSLAEAIAQLEQQTSWSFAYNPDQLPENAIVRSFENVSLNKVLAELLEPADLQYAVRGQVIVIYPQRTPKPPPAYTISGYVEDLITGERLVGAGVYDLKTGKGTITNSQGFFSLTLPPDSVKLVISSMGYAIQFERFYHTHHVRRLVQLKPDLELEAVEILDSDSAVSLDELSGVSISRIPMSELERLPALMGEPDIFNALSLLPGVQSGGGVSGGLYVRGGSPDQNLVLIDGVPVYNSAHLFGLYSIFNSDVLKSVELIKGGFPARFGGRLSSVVDLQMKEGNKKKLSGRGSLGLATGKMMLEGPIVKDKTSFLISARRTLMEPYWLLINRLAERAEGNRLGYSFVDLNGKLCHRIGKSDDLELGFYTGGDRFSSGYRIAQNTVEDQFDFGLKWGNTVGVLRWSRNWSRKLHSNVSVFNTQYNYRAESHSLLSRVGQDTRSQSLALTSSVNDWGSRIEFNYLPGPGHFVRFGGTATRHSFLPETFQQDIDVGGAVRSTDVRQKRLNSFEYTAFVEDNLALTRRLYLNLGLHFSLFQADTTTYRSLQPRLSLGYGLPGELRATASFSTMTQYLHLLSNSGVGLPTDLWVPSTDKIPPQNSRQVGIGLEKRFPKSGFELRIEGYYKLMDSLIDYQTGVNFLASRNWEDVVERGGEGKSMGLEVFLHKSTGRWRGWLGYTLAKTDRQFENINFGNVFPYKYDRRHDFSAVVLFALNERIEFSANWVYGTGSAITFPEAVFYAPSSPLLGFSELNDGETVTVIVDYGERNSFRLPAFHRLDVNMRVKKEVKWGEVFWNFGVYNVYNRQNPLFLFLRADYSLNPDAPEIKARKMSLLPILPEVNFGFRF